MFEWCYVDHSIISYFGYLPQNMIGKSIFDYFKLEDLTTIREIHENSKNSKEFCRTLILYINRILL